MLKCLRPDRATHLLSLFATLSCKITKNPTFLTVDFQTRDFDTNWVICMRLLVFISKVDLPVSSQYRSEEGGENIGIIVENKHLNGI